MQPRYTLIKLREDNKWVQKDLADKLDVSQQYISQMESGRRKPTLIVAKKLEGLYKTPMEILFPDIFLNIHTTERNAKSIKTT